MAAFLDNKRYVFTIDMKHRFGWNTANYMQIDKFCNFHDFDI